MKKRWAQTQFDFAHKIRQERFQRFCTGGHSALRAKGGQSAQKKIERDGSHRTHLKSMNSSSGKARDGISRARHEMTN